MPKAVALLEQQGRVTEIADPEKRIASIARNYADNPANTIIVSPDNASRRAINQAVRSELQERGIVESENHALRVLAPRSDMTGADRAWAARYEVGDVLHYQRGSKTLGIEQRSYARVVSTDPKLNLLTVEKSDGQQITYDPARLHGISAYREIEREFAVGDRLQFTAPNRELGVANRDLGTIQKIGEHGEMTVRMDGGKRQGGHIRSGRDAALRSRLRRDLAQFAGTHLRARSGQHGHQRSPGTHQHPVCLRLRLARFARRADLSPTTSPNSPRNSARTFPKPLRSRSARARNWLLKLP